MQQDLELLQALKTSEIIPILKSIRLGKDHLQANLSPEQFKRMINILPPVKSRTHTIADSIQEKAGNLLIICNTLITSFFGMMLGALNLFGLKVNFNIVWTALLVSIISCATLGFLTLKQTRQQAQDSIVNYKLFRLELYILMLIIDKREKLAKKFMRRINALLDFHFKNNIEIPEEELNILNLTDKIEKVFTEFQPADNHLTDEHNQRVYATGVEKIKQKIQQMLKKNKKLQSIANFESLPERIAKHVPDDSYLLVFSEINNHPKAKKIDTRGWFRKNYIDILVGLMPTLIGGFSSMFVFLVGVPGIFRTLDMVMDVNYEHLFVVKDVGLCTAFILTLYFGFSYAYGNYKNFVRATHKSRCDNKIEVLNHKIMRLTREVSLLDRMDGLLDTIITLRDLGKTIHKEEQQKLELEVSETN